MHLRNRLKTWLTIPAVLLFSAALLSGCGQAMVLDPKGPIAAAQKDLIMISTILCAAILVPVLVLTAYIVYRYRERPESTAKYQPNWAHSTLLETIWWVIPILMIAVLAVITVRYTQELEPSKPIGSEEKELVVQVTSLDWKWLFQYPEQGIATVNYLYIPEDVPVRFELTSDAPMNSFWIPQLGGQIYTMSGMAMTLYLQADEAGTYFGSGANFSGEHFAKMSFKVNAVSEGEFEAWVESVKASAPALTDEGYEALALPGTTEKQSFSAIPKDLFHRTVTKYASHGIGTHGGHEAALKTTEDVHNEHSGH
jgi:cytochrome o ubiquinol oxidase subunit 2